MFDDIFSDNTSDIEIDDDFIRDSIMEPDTNLVPRNHPPSQLSMQEELSRRDPGIMDFKFFENLKDHFFGCDNLFSPARDNLFSPASEDLSLRALPVENEPVAMETKETELNFFDHFMNNLDEMQT